MIRGSWTGEEDKFLKDFYFHRGVRYCADKLERTPGSVAARVAKLGVSRQGENTLRAQFSQGYIVIQSNFNRQFLHTLLAEMKLGRKLQEDEIVHHVDGNILNNHLDNLKVLTRGEHQKEHWGENCDGRRNPANGRFI